MNLLTHIFFTNFICDMIMRLVIRKSLSHYHVSNVCDVLASSRGEAGRPPNLHNVATVRLLHALLIRHSESSIMLYAPKFMK